MRWGPPQGLESPFAPSSPFAAAIDRLFTITLVVCAAIFVIVTVAIAYALVTFRARRDGPEPPQVTGSLMLEILWTAVPVVVVAVLFVITVRTMAASDPAADRAPDVVVVSHQWWWEVRYPSGVVTANEVHLPVGKSILVRLESADVIHDFWVPQLSRKMDAVPGHPNVFWLRADAPGSYGGACSEYCGLAHAWMRILALAEPAATFDAWQGAELGPAAAPAGGSAADGERLFDSLACGACHAVAGRFEGGVAPDLTHVASRSTLAAGVVENTPENLAAWLQNPQAIKPGSRMPSFNLSDAQVHDLLAFLEGLR